MAISALKGVTPKFSAVAAVKPEREYHCHIYYDQNTQADKQVMLTALQDTFKTEISQHSMDVFDVPKAPWGPHMKPNLAVHFKESGLGTLIELLTQKSGKLLALLHTDTGNEKLDHAKPFWMGIPSTNLPLDYSWFDKNA